MELNKEEELNNFCMEYSCRDMASILIDYYEKKIAKLEETIDNMAQQILDM